MFFSSRGREEEREGGRRREREGGREGRREEWGENEINT